ncbi:hypothetical protein B0O99DRAFT_677505 [Bisporella sp. PMI_857]|nr:hypothetical protein B0O99DRAFT_677505 [Bisporella sp. PMI_857]
MLLTRLLLSVIGLGFISASPFPAELVSTSLSEHRPSAFGIRCDSSFNGDIIQSPSTPAIKYQLRCSTAAGPSGPSECLSIRHVCVVFPTVTGCATVKLGPPIKGTCPSKKRQSLPSGCATEFGQNLPQNLNA